MKSAVYLVAGCAVVVIAAVAAEAILVEIGYRRFWERRGAWWL